MGAGVPQEWKRTTARAWSVERVAGRDDQAKKGRRRKRRLPRRYVVASIPQHYIHITYRLLISHTKNNQTVRKVLRYRLAWAKLHKQWDLMTHIGVLNVFWVWARDERQCPGQEQSTAPSHCPLKARQPVNFSNLLACKLQVYWS